ncbi:MULTISPECIES: ATP-grasp domain-containing protein [unclassified Micromonospora]|uniref:ATP-grasp domain-containing protein n=1 Tax=unclassified Micromonospora TaxID=2617518 RepID=UPI0033B6C9F7
MTNHYQSTRGEPRVALVTCTDLVDLDPDDRLVLAPLAARGIAAEAVVWDDPDVDWSSYDLIVLRSPWDYALRRDEFVAWAASVPALVNPADVVRWNTDKRYLAELSAAGVPTVPTSWVEPGESWLPPADTGEYVIKPAVSAGSQDTGRYDLADPEHRELAGAHVRRLSDAGRVTMIQPYLTAVDTEGETALLFLAGPDGLAFSHAIRKGPMLTGPDLGPDGLYKAEEITARTAAPAQLAVAEKTLAVVPGGTAQLLYARVDLIPGPDGAPVLVELELTEPSLFIGYADGAPDRLAEAVTTHLARRG